MSKLSKKQKGELYYKLRLEGLSNGQIAQRHGDLPYAVAARVSEHRKANKLPLLTKKKKKKPEKPNNSSWGSARFELDEDTRAKNLAECYTRKDGILQCPKRACEGYGLPNIFVQSKNM